MKFTRGHAARLVDPQLEAIRANQAQQIDELQTAARTTDTNGRFLTRRVLTSANGTYVPSSGTKMARIRMVGGGGGGGGAGAGGAGIGGGGGGDSGWYLDFVVTPSKALTGGAFTCGAGGAAGAATPTAGGTGGDTTIVLNGTTYTAKGGPGGTAAVLSTNGVTGPNIRQTGSTDVVAMGIGSLMYDSGGIGFWFNAAAGVSGEGGSSPLGEAGYAQSAAFTATGIAAAAVGGSGGAGGSATTGNSAAGGRGGAGMIIIEEYS